MDIAAVALGANLVEKTITEDRMTRSVEHVMSLEPHEMKKFVVTIREIEVGLGRSRRILHEDEKIKRNDLRRSVYLRAEAKAGMSLAECDIEFRRPGHGISPDLYERLKNARLKNDLPPGYQLTLSDLI